MDEHTLNDLLECSVCLERLDTSSKVLPCQHTFCRKCLEVIYASRQELRCPECRVLVDTKIDELPPNVLLMRILEGMKNAATKQNHASNNTSERSDEIKGLSSNPILAPSSLTDIDERSRLNQLQQQQQQQYQIKQISQFQQQQNLQLQNQLPPTTTAAQLSPPQQQHHQQQQQHQHPHNQQRRCIVPHAYALYDFDSNELSDLKFKKGDLILLRRKIDSNWYVGQLKGVEGNFPLNYVQVVVPLPTSQCVALYDFKMGPNEEEGCLTFKKGTVIQVLRRVDHNWAEGRIGSSIGIFPIAFVELNHLAKQLLESGYMTTTTTTTTLNNTQQLQQQSQTSQEPRTNEMRTVPPIPCTQSNESSTAAATASTSVATSTHTTNTQTTTAAAYSSSSNSSATTSPISTTTNLSSACSSTTTSSLNTVFHSMPNSPQSSSGPSTPQHSAHMAHHASSSVRLRNNDLKHKRHSLNALLNNGATALSITQQTNRHSAEILSVPNDFEHEMDTTAASATGQTTAAREQQHHASNLPQHSPQSLQNQTQSNQQQQQQQQPPSAAARHNVLKTCVQQNVPPSLPWGYLALYPYKPRKSDELELKKGCVYMVTERCLDGWFKGKNWKDISGVFPGNYVTPLRARDQQQLMHSWKLIPPSNYPPAAFAAPQQMGSQTAISTSGQKTTQQQQQHQQLASNYSISMRNDLENINARLTLANLTPHQPIPPDLPPRQLAASPTNIGVTQPQQVSSKEIRDKEALKEKPTATGCMSTSSSSTASNTTSSASAGLKKFLTHIKSRSKSPGAAIVATAAATATNNTPNCAQVKPQPAKQTQLANISSVTPVHVRSGSCPSQLLHTLPNEITRGLASENKAVTPQSLSSSQTPNYGSQRIKGPKERPSLENARPTIDSTLRSIYANHIQQQSALLPNKCGLQYQQQIPPPANANLNAPTTVIHRKSHSLDASNILHSSSLNNVITPTASTSSLAGGGGSGGAAAAAQLKPSVPTQCNINAAAIHASATTKSTQSSMNESRFRCVVPYPPNSDIELELQVGDIIFVYRKQKNGWYKGTNSRTYKTGLFPASFVEPDL